ncbi:flavodoxin family protein [Terrisporobacter sp.]
MKIAVIHGQNHKGCSYHVSKSLLEKLTTENNISEFFLPKDMPKFCTGCYTCLVKGEEYCPHYKYIKPITESILKSDLLVFTTPVYCLRASGAMKALLDHYFTWFVVHRPKEEMYFKKAIIISSGAGNGMRQAAKDIKTSLFYWGISNIKVYKLRSMAMSWPDISDKNKEKIENDMSKLANQINNAHKKERVSLRCKFIFYLMRMAQQKDKESCSKDNEYWQEKGWLDDKRPWRK